MNANSYRYRQPAEILQNLIRFDTTNPPGKEAECIDYINRLIRSAGIDTRILYQDPARPNLICRIKGNGNAPPLLLYGHVDVVTTAGQVWQYPPFEGRIVDGFLWGRGALDMKGAVAMMLCAFLHAKYENIYLAGDVVLCIMSDEEAGGDFGAKFLVENHTDYFKRIRYAISEFGGFSFYFKGKKFFPIEVIQKQVCSIKATIRSRSGHGALVMKDGAMAKLARMLNQLDKKYLPVHITPVVRTLVEQMAAAFPFPRRMVMRQLLNPLFTDTMLKLIGEKGRDFIPMFRNTINATIVRGGDKVNVLPSEIEVMLDGRLLPGCVPENIIGEIRAIIDDDIELEVIRYDPGPFEPDMGLFDTLAAVLRTLDPGGIPIPYLLAASSDARFFSNIGIQTYGFIPMQLPESLDFARLIHAADERIPVEALTFGSEAIYQLLQCFHE
ncbi:MAG: M20/M25/M40 family metallo-hydrolase [Deltaproteobacteria bacterium]|nr:M20/M25/M40 family metallo-hydrolase [Deltaproteobacteria bacterium]